MEKDPAARDEAVLDAAEVVAVPEGVDAACWAHIVCPECGSVLSEGHRRGCSHSADSSSEPR